MFPCNSLTLRPCMKRILNLTLAALLSLTANAQTKVDSLRADSNYKSMVLQGVEVVKQKSLVKADIDKITYDIESDPDSKTNSVMEMLRKVPMVTVDGEDNIQVNGSSSFKVYVNSKPNNLNYNDSPRSYSGGSRKTIGTVSATSSDINYNNSSKNHGNFRYGSFVVRLLLDCCSIDVR